MAAPSHVMTVSRNGQVSIPAETRARWRTRKVLVVDAGLVAPAGRLRARRCRRTRCAVSMADCIAARGAAAGGDALATSDPHLLALCHAEGIATVVLASSDGSRWAAPGGVG